VDAEELNPHLQDSYSVPSKNLKKSASLGIRFPMIQQ